MIPPPAKISVHIAVIITAHGHIGNRIDSMTADYNISGSCKIEWEIPHIKSVVLKAYGVYLNDDIELTVRALQHRLRQEVTVINRGHKHANLWYWQYSAIFTALRLLRGECKSDATSKEWFKIQEYDYRKSKPIR